MRIFLLSITLLSSVISSTFAQPFNHEINATTNNPMLVGKINKTGLSSGNYAKWFDKNYDDYKPDTQKTASLKQLLPAYTITAFMGTWCGDSKKEVPRFYKVLEAAEFPMERLTLVAVNRARDAYKQSPGGEEEGVNIHRVPTFIFYKDGKEVNRIVEHPINTFEDDMLQLLTSAYTPNYHAVTITNNALTTMGLKKFSKKSKRLASSLKPLAKNLYELNTYSSVLFFSGRQEEAIAVARLNKRLFPEEANTHVSLANKLFKTNRLDEARQNFEKALILDPDNKGALKALKEMNTTN